MKRFTSVILAAMIFLNVFTMPINAETAETKAFPGAEGGGMYSLGARGAENIEVYHVTNLNDSGKGSFRDAVSKGGRIIVFDVAGNINLENILKITNVDNITILGQTAPGEGICVSGESTLFSNCNNVIVRYMRFRPGDTCFSQEDGLGVRKCTNFIVDHCSVSWSVDECLSAYENKDFTAQYCIISESLNRSLHAKGEHGYGGIWGGINASFHHNLVSTHKSRMPRIGTSQTVHSYNDTPDYESLVDIRNNVFYNWRSGEMSYGGENGVRVNLVNNYYKSTIEKKNKLFYQSYTG
ncbi:MAG: pectate lyase, partial [Firmicutes bacterium]|nr:pectate lyase [Bacillota bacterium]